MSSRLIVIDGAAAGLDLSQAANRKLTPGRKPPPTDWDALRGDISATKGITPTDVSHAWLLFDVADAIVALRAVATR